MGHASARHWDSVYDRLPATGLSWHEDQPRTSLRLIAEAATQKEAVIDVGAGASSLVDALLEAGWTDLTVLDVSAVELALVQNRLQGRPVQFVTADLLTWHSRRRYDVWHPPAVFHFLVTPQTQQRYIQTAAAAVRSGGALILGVFAFDGPTECSGLPVRRWDSASLAAAFADAFDLEHSHQEEHRTPGGLTQAFTWTVFRRR
jgi:SAM-dependent methyltransferase